MRMTRKSRRQRQRREKLKKEVISIAKKGFGLTAAAMLFWSTFSAEPANAMPSNGSVAAGNAAIAQHGNVMNILQSSNRAIINWRAFSIAANEIVNFNQPNANAVMLNRVLGTDPSKIFGQMNANGKVFLVNPNGVLFAPGAQVNVGGLLATTHSISDTDFMNGNYKFISTNPDGQVINQGTIVAQNQGIVSLLAPEAINEGVIVAQKGTVTIASANQATFDFTGDGKLQLIVDESAVKALAENRGIVEAEGGLVLMTASAHRELGSAVVNQSGIVRATSLDGTAGAVELNAADGTANLAGTIDVSGASAGAAGGTVDIFAKDITLESSANINASGDTGGGTVKIGGDWQGSGDAPHAETVTIANGAVINADAITNGDGGTVVAWSDGVTKFDGTISAKGGQESGNGGMVETSGHYLQITDGSVNASAVNGKGGEWLLDPYNITIKDTSLGDNVGSNGKYTAIADDSVVDVFYINKALSGGTNVTIRTGEAGDGGTQDGNITVKDNIIKTDNNTTAILTLEAHDSIIVEANIEAEEGILNVNLHSDISGQFGGAVSLADGKEITTNGGYVNIYGGKAEDGKSYSVSQKFAPGVNIAGSINTSVLGSKGGAIEIYGYATGDYNGVLISGSVESGGGDITINGLAPNATTADGVSITGKVDAGDGTVNISTNDIRPNSTSVPANSSISISGAGVKGKNVNLTADKITGTAVSGTGAGALTIKTLTDQKISVGDGVTGGLELDKGLFSGSTFAETVIESKADLTTGEVAFGSNKVTLTGKNIDVSDNLIAAGTLTLNALTNAKGDGTIAAGTLNLQGQSAAFNLNNANTVNILTGNVGSLNFNNSQGFTVSANGLTISNAGKASTLTAAGDINIEKDISSGELTVEAKGGSIYLTDATINTNNNAATLKASNSITLDDGVINAGTDENKSNVTLNSNKLFVTDPNNSIAGSGVLNINVYTPSSGSGIQVGGSESDSFTGLIVAGDAFEKFGSFSWINIGGSANTGDINISTATSNNNLKVQTGSNIIFNTDAALRTDNKELILDASKIDFGAANDDTAILEAGTGILTLSANTISNWKGVNFSETSSGYLYITPKSDSRDIYVGGSSNGGGLSVDEDAFNRINAGEFANVTIGKTDTINGSVRNYTGTGAVYIGDFTLENGNTNLVIASPGGAASFLSDANVKMTTNGYLAFYVNSLTQPDPIEKFEVKSLLLKGKGKGTGSNFILNQDNNDITNFAAADIDSLEIVNSGDILTIGEVGGTTGVTAETITFVTDRLQVNEEVTSTGTTSTTGTLTITPKTTTRTIQLGGSKTITDNGTLHLDSVEISKLHGKLIYFGDDTTVTGTTFKGDVVVTGPVTFTSDVEIFTDGTATGGTVTMNGDIHIGSDGSKDLTITAYDLDNTATIYLQNLTLKITKGLGKLKGTVQGTETGKLSILNPNDDDIYIVTDADDPDYDEGYAILYETLEYVMKGFDGFSITGEKSIFLKDGTLAASLKLDAKENITVDGEVIIKATGNKKLTVLAEAGDDFTLTDGSKLIVDGKNVNISITAEETNLGVGSAIDSGTGSFTLTTNTLNAHYAAPDSLDNAQITGKGTLTLQQKSGNLYVLGTGSTLNSGNNLLITQAQLNGDLFDDGFENLTLGNAGGGIVYVDDLKVDNNLTIRTGGNSSDKIIIGAKGLKIDGDDRRMTLQGHTITNNGDAGATIDTQTTGTINLYANNLAFTGADVVTGNGTLGLGTYNGTTNIYLGTSGGAGYLNLTNDYFSTAGNQGVFGSGFTQYNIGYSGQGYITVNGAVLDKDTTLTANYINFDGTINLGKGTGTTLTLDARNRSTQKTAASVITADNLVLKGQNHYLTTAKNDIGTLTATANIVHLKSETLTVNKVTATGSGVTNGATQDPIYDPTKGAIYLHTTATGSSGSESLVVEGPIEAKNGDITLVSDTMRFDTGKGAKVIGNNDGLLNVRQANKDVSMGIGTGGGTLQLGTELFNGQVFTRSFKTVYLGRDDSEATVEIGGDLTFVDDTVILGGKGKDNGLDGMEGGEIKILDGTTITTTDTVKNFEFKARRFYTEEDTYYTINTGSSDFYLTVDEFDLWQSTIERNGFFTGSGTVTIRTYNSDREFYIGGDYGYGPGYGNWLYLDSRYFDFNYDYSYRVFYGYNEIIFGRTDGTKVLTFSGDNNFDTNVKALQNKGVKVAGKIYSKEKNFTVESKQVDIEEAEINADGGNITITTDTLTIDDTSTIKSEGGELAFYPFTFGKDISFKSGSTNSLVLEYEWFTHSKNFKNGFSKLIFGGGGNIDVSELTLSDGFTEELTLHSTGSDKTIKADYLTMNDGVLSVENADGYFEMTGSNVKKLGKINVGKTINIRNNGTNAKKLNITKSITGGGEINIETEGNLTIDEEGSITSDTGDIFLIAKDGNFINEHPATSDDTSDTVLKAGSGKRWVIFSKDSIGDDYGNLKWDFRRYNTEYGDPNKELIADNPTNKTDYNGNGIAYASNPELVIEGTHIYGESFPTFFLDTDHFEITFPKQYEEIDDYFITQMIDKIKESENFSRGNTISTIYAKVNKDNDGIVKDGMGAYGNGEFGQTYENGNYYVTYTGTNALNYKITVKLWVKPKELTVTTDKVTRIYDGTSNGNTSGNFYITGFVTGETKRVITNLNEEDVVDFTTSYNVGNSENVVKGDDVEAINAGNYIIGLDGTLDADNYYFTYVDNLLEITKRPVLVTAENDSKEYDGKAYTGNGKVTYSDIEGNANSGVVEKDKKNIDSLISGDIKYENGTGDSKSDSEGAVNVKDGGYVIDIGGAVTDTDGNILYYTYSTLDADNYEFVYAPGKLTITPKKVTVTAKSYIKFYNGKPYYTNTGGYTYKGFIDGEDESVLTGDGSVFLDGSANGAINVGNYVINADGTLTANNYTFKYDPGTLTIYTSDAIEAEKTLNSNNNALPTGFKFSLFNLPISPITDLTPPAPSTPPEADANIVLESNNSNSKGTLKNEGAGFALHFDYYENDRGHAGNSRTLGAIPILFAQDGEQKLDAIYVINYNHDNGKLAILPAAQRVTTPKLDEVRPDANHEFAIHYQSTPLGLFEVSHGNGIVAIRPVDDMALESLIAGEKSVTKAVLANGILAAIKNISVMPDQIRAVYIFLEK